MRIIQVAIVALLAVTLANAQTAVPALSADIPFAFEMRGVTLPVGEYRINFSENRTWFAIRSVDSKEAAMGLTFTVDPTANSANEAKLVFNKYGDRYFLSQVWHPNFVRQLPKSKQERELVTSRVIAQNPVRVVVAARLVR